MYPHGPSFLKGPSGPNRAWWTLPIQAEEAAKPNTKHQAPSTKNESEIRAELVERIRREIAAGTYETPEKWQAAFDRLARRLTEE